ncbi:capsular polysaccharide export protein, LipB/KpsS family [Kluyvera intermedia]|uniref:capsular polysaccharide export protein, LipB/KpsS family n=1 Tax=Kluyvera intermedia TaxID=61648 RepID=UPI0035238D10
MTGKGIFFSDKKNINKSSFSKLFSYLERNKIHYTSDTDDVMFKYNFGDYRGIEHFCGFTEKHSKYMEVSRGELFELTYMGINLFDAYRSEALSYYLKIKSFRALLQNNTSREDIFNAFFDIDKNNLVMCVCISIYWADYWLARLNMISKYKYVGVFSGAQIFNMMLIEISKRSAMTPLLMESFFTGSEFYLEEKYEPLPNNANIKFDNIYFNSNYCCDHSSLRKAIKRTNNKQNKNNTKNQSKNIDIGNDGRRVITVIAQVVNDFSIINTAVNYLNSIEFYKQVIIHLLKEECNYVVLKTHPWEIKKNKKRITQDAIMQYISTMSDSYQSRFKVIESWDVAELCHRSNYIITLCSQGGIECAMNGKKTIQFGNAFYGRKGFTHDYVEIEDFMNDFHSGYIYPELTCDEQNNFYEFLDKLFSQHLVSNLDSNYEILDRYFR